jgi:hypothetical protein
MLSAIIVATLRMLRSDVLRADGYAIMKHLMKRVWIGHPSRRPSKRTENHRQAGMMEIFPLRSRIAYLI